MQLTLREVDEIQIITQRIAILYRTFIYGHGLSCTRLSDHYRCYYWLVSLKPTQWKLSKCIVLCTLNPFISLKDGAIVFVLCDRSRMTCKQISFVNVRTSTEGFSSQAATSSFLQNKGKNQRPDVWCGRHSPSSSRTYYQTNPNYFLSIWITFNLSTSCCVFLDKKIPV